MHNFIKPSITMLSKEEEIHLFENLNAAIADNNTRLVNKLHEQIVIQYSPIINSAVRKLNGYKLDPSELASEGLIALTNAMQNFDMSLGFRFGTYAGRMVKLTLLSHVAKNYFMSNVCAHPKNKKLFFGIRRMMSEEMHDHNRLTDGWMERIAIANDVEVERVAMMSAMISDPYHSLNAPVGDDTDMTKQDMLTDGSALQDELLSDNRMAILHKELISNALQTLDDRTRDIVNSQVLCDDDDKQTLHTLGERHSISKERVRQIRVAGLKKLHSHINTQIKLRNISPVELLEPC